jgi:hypothetical protein
MSWLDKIREVLNYFSRWLYDDDPDLETRVLMISIMGKQLELETGEYLCDDCFKRLLASGVKYNTVRFVSAHDGEFNPQQVHMKLIKHGKEEKRTVCYRKLDPEKIYYRSEPYELTAERYPLRMSVEKLTEPA